VDATPFETERDLKRTRSDGGEQVLNGRDLGIELRRRFSLTHAEANIALLLAEGLTYAEIAERLGVSYHTVHTHVKAVHSKARVSSNGRLLALIRNIEGL
jgi:DNA-binding CsgD family transcriptional regulator